MNGELEEAALGGQGTGYPGPILGDRMYITFGTPGEVGFSASD